MVRVNFKKVGAPVHFPGCISFVYAKGDLVIFDSIGRIQKTYPLNTVRDVVSYGQELYVSGVQAKYASFGPEGIRTTPTQLPVLSDHEDSP